MLKKECKLDLLHVVHSGKFLNPDSGSGGKVHSERLGAILFASIVYYVPRRLMRVITRRAKMLAEDRSRGAISSARILSESCNYPNCVHLQIFYFM